MGYRIWKQCEIHTNWRWHWRIIRVYMFILRWRQAWKWRRQKHCNIVSCLFCFSRLLSLVLLFSLIVVIVYIVTYRYTAMLSSHFSIMSTFGERVLIIIAVSNELIYFIGYKYMLLCIIYTILMHIYTTIFGFGSMVVTFSLLLLTLWQRQQRRE